MKDPFDAPYPYIYRGISNSAYENMGKENAPKEMKFDDKAKNKSQWVSKDGLRFTAKISLDSAATDKWTEVRVLVDGNAIVISGRGRKARAIKGRWAVSYSADAQDVRRRHFVIARSGETTSTALLSVPATSRCVALLDALTKP
jgi:hypothetical protein